VDYTGELPEEQKFKDSNTYEGFIRQQAFKEYIKNNFDITDSKDWHKLPRGLKKTV
jgi:hypothetical protein